MTAPDDMLSGLQGSLDYSFADSILLEQALTHPSCAGDCPGPLPDNQRLEFLGDAVLQLVVSLDLFQANPDMPEGELTRARAAMVNARHLARVADRVNLGDVVRLGRSEEVSGGRRRQSTRADALEAVLGAVYLDGGFDAAQRVIRRLLEDDLSAPEDILVDDNPKGALQEYTQRHLRLAPEYEIISVSGPEHAPSYEVCVRIGDSVTCHGSGGSRREAEKEAAAAAIALLRREGSSAAP